MTALSSELWGIDWTRHVPFRLGSVVVEASTYERAAPFVADHYRAIFEEDTSRSRFTSASPSARKARYYELFGDFFEFRADGRTVGLLAGTPHDWATYYVRSAGMLGAYQGYGVIQSFLMQVVFEVLREAGVERVELDVSPSNLPMMHIATRMRFHPTGTLLSERWGAQIHFTKFLDPAAEGAFVDGFCTGRRYQKGEHDEKALRTA
ncbi:MAG TPA: GNAT family N-acetyltransferase, partial [Polyangiaceae bacterium]|nr:GNAT family N-acetyltransferase [Polyangiaceae bacterium]